MDLLPQYMYPSETKYFHYYCSFYVDFHTSIYRINLSTMFYLFLYTICFSFIMTRLSGGCIVQKLSLSGEGQESGA